VAQLSQDLGTAFQRCQLLASMLNTFLEHVCLLDIDSKLITIFSTSIIYTRGPTSYAEHSHV
uniref:Uncharacterized protein n=1 Tax=Chelonoidis abingdonii TaxID=106734 RepID=A0A8C0G1N0_CHEAB